MKMDLCVRSNGAIPFPMKTLILTTLFLISGCSVTAGPIVEDEGQGGAGGAAPVACEGSLLEAGAESLVAYERGGVVVLLEAGETECVSAVLDTLCIYRGGEPVEDNLIPAGAIAAETNSTKCAPPTPAENVGKAE